VIACRGESRSKPFLMRAAAWIVDSGLSPAAVSRKGFCMSFQFLPFYTGDYLRDTRHLSPLKHGVYVLLLMHCWDQKGPVPLDEQESAGIANCRSTDEIDALRYILDKFFVRMDDGHYNKRMQAEIERAESISRARSDAGRLGYQARANQLPSKSRSIAKQVHLPLPPHHTPTPTTTPTKSKAFASSDLQSLSADTEVVERIPLNDGTEHPIDKAFVAELDRAYPSVDPPATLREIRAWCVANPAKRKTRTGVRRFINAWFSREQNK
jgi:uncharacterized protein YdaU (DUF1376 family)